MQAIGAGGGVVESLGSEHLTAVLGATAGATGNGGVLDVTHNGQIVTSGVGSHGVLLQSIGGGGGAVLSDAQQVSVTTRADNLGDGLAISFHQVGDIWTDSAGSDGVIAQSLGGGGGWVDGAFAGAAGGVGTGGAIDLSIDGQVLALQADSTAIFAQSAGSLGGGDITVHVDNTIRGGSGSGVGIRLDGGADNTLFIASTASVTAVSGVAIAGGIGNDVVNNLGTVIGNLDLGAGHNTFNNLPGATFVAFNRIGAVGGTTDFVNDGEFHMGLDAPSFPLDLAKGALFATVDQQGDPAYNLLYGARVINAVALTGNFTQSAQGHLAFDIAFGPYASDQVTVSGDATVAGRGDVTLTWLENTTPVLLFATGGQGIDNGLTIHDSMALHYRVAGGADGIALSFVSDFGQPFLNRNGRALGAHLDSALGLGGAHGLGRLLALLGNLQPGQQSVYQAVFSQLDPEPYLAPWLVQFDAANTFARQVFGCAGDASMPERGCNWAQMNTHGFTRGSDSENVAIDSSGVWLGFGFERPLDNRWSLSGALQYDTTDHLQVDHYRALLGGDGVHAGLGATYRAGDGTVASLSVSGGWQWFQGARQVGVFGSQQGRASIGTGYLQADARVARPLEAGRWFARPSLTAALTALHQGRFQEHGLEGLGIAGLGNKEVLLAFTPEMVLGVLLHGQADRHTALELSVARVFNSQSELSMPYRLQGGDPAAAPALISTSLPRAGYRLGMDLNVVAGERFDLQLGHRIGGGN
ncbi:MAG: hypothetical protein NTZ79_13980, partial [Proteobacteria bacterium]|nr:hypothetical protein [Pseudomonadota bacterium]